MKQLTCLKIVLFMLIFILSNNLQAYAGIFRNDDGGAIFQDKDGSFNIHENGKTEMFDSRGNHIGTYESSGGSGLVEGGFAILQLVVVVMLILFLGFPCMALLSELFNKKLTKNEKIKSVIIGIVLFLIILTLSRYLNVNLIIVLGFGLIITVLYNIFIGNKVKVRNIAGTWKQENGKDRFDFYKDKTFRDKSKGFKNKSYDYDGYNKLTLYAYEMNLNEDPTEYLFDYIVEWINEDTIILDNGSTRSKYIRTRML